MLARERMIEYRGMLFSSAKYGLMAHAPRSEQVKPADAIITDIDIAVAQRESGGNMLSIERLSPRLIGGVKHVNPHVLVLFYVLAVAHCSLATSIVIRGNGKDIAVASDSRQGDDQGLGTYMAPNCKMRIVPGGIFCRRRDDRLVRW